MLLIAGQLDGGSLAGNLIVTMRSIDMSNPMLLGGLEVQMNGESDAFLLEGPEIATWSTSEQTWRQDTLLQLAAWTPNGTWDASVGRCA